MIEYNGYMIVKDDKYPTNFRIKVIGKGSVHLSLRGLYTKDSLAKRAIDNFINARRGKVNGKQKEPVSAV